MSIRSSRIKTRTVQIRELCSPEKVKTEAYSFLTLFLSATQLAALDPVTSKTDPKIQHSNNDAMILIRSKSTSFFSSPPQLKSSFSQEQGPPNT
ncbi:hypothetical protein AVEN_174504-1 [Araneus ventricosus]|uniref:Uncharacterized protein n=1 Tax=Araneus ventricosus TaxID=182803 RepID=A0A4Y2XB46_ARAVE|nr:hypothetical protein AVEN_174504-1 [Araneus ventricosus]